MRKNSTIRNCPFAFKCEEKWSALQRTSEVKIRFCEKCLREVHYCSTDNELASSIKLNHCVAIPILSSSLEGDEVIEVEPLLGEPF